MEHVNRIRGPRCALHIPFDRILSAYSCIVRDLFRSGKKNDTTPVQYLTGMFARGASTEVAFSIAAC